ncbi:uncharacterized protein Dvir_GJ21892 [Drosophila virilis]|uniref:Uncharacterized protein n=1 Tax=Drosophila virilis TaxID=7244 RepID=B4LP12_DROVI|nr:uncharacterized protein LOC6625792 [Drosophila virilis]EDW61181.2 uncharacterized protein Dvir_GJ21892 [Drosophila virilis]
MIDIMSSPIHNHYRFAATRHTQSSDSDKSELLNNPEEGSTNILLDDLQPQPLAAAMYSLQLVADVVNKMQSALHQKPKNIVDSRPAPSFCYFFIDMQPQSGNNYNYSHYNLDSCQSYKNMSDKEYLSRSPLTVEAAVFKLKRQRSISECSDDSFICFEEDSESIDSAAVGCSDCNAADKISDSYNNSQEVQKRVRFNLKPKVHVMHAWDFAYRAARKGDWQEVARDRDRFQQRINRIAPILNNVLSSNHREKVYTARFLDIK